LTATNSAGSDVETKTSYITVTAAVQVPVANFSASTTSVTAGGTVTFTDLSTNTPTSWAWTFTGGTPSSSTSQNPSVVYNTAGTYSVSLTATNSAGSDVETKTSYITVTAVVQVPVANFSASTTSVTAGGTVTFTDLSTNTPTSRSWTFDGGTPSSSTSQNPVITYNTAGSYTVSLTATNSAGSDSEIKADYITVTSASTGDYPVVDADQEACYNTTGNVITCGSSLNGQDAQYTTITPSYTNNGDGTVTDHNTGLIWQRSNSTAMLWTSAASYCDSLVLGGQSDWRLPNIKELYSLIDFDGYTGNMSDMYYSWTPANWKLYIDGSYITTDTSATFIQEYGNADTGGRILDGQCWTSTDPVGTVMNGTDSATGGNFCDGRIKSYPKTSLKFTRCVRGTTDYGVNSFSITDNGDTVTDSSTGLVWTRAYSNDATEFPGVTSLGLGDGSMDWEDALSFCENLSYAGYTDWKLPDAKELHSIVLNPTSSSLPAIDTNYFDLAAVQLPDYCNGGTFTSFPYFWTGTTHVEYSVPNSAQLGSKAVYIAFGKAWGSTDGGATWIDAHSPGAQRSDPKTGDPGSTTWECGFGPQGDYIGIYNYVRCVRRP
jgi:PKD repeat protein